MIWDINNYSDDQLVKMWNKLNFPYFGVLNEDKIFIYKYNFTTNEDENLNDAPNKLITIVSSFKELKNLILN